MIDLLVYFSVYIVLGLMVSVFIVVLVPDMCGTGLEEAPISFMVGMVAGFPLILPIVLLTLIYQGAVDAISLVKR